MIYAANQDPAINIAQRLPSHTFASLVMRFLFLICFLLASYNIEAMELVDHQKAHLTNTQPLLRTHTLVPKSWGKTSFKFGPKTGLVELVSVPWFDSHIYELSEGKICIPSDDRSCIQMNVANGQLTARVVSRAYASNFEGRGAIHLVYKNSLFKLSRGREYDSTVVSLGTDSRK